VNLRVIGVNSNFSKSMHQLVLSSQSLHSVSKYVSHSVLSIDISDWLALLWLC